MKIWLNLPCNADSAIEDKFSKNNISIAKCNAKMHIEYLKLCNLEVSTKLREKRTTVLAQKFYVEQF